MFLSMIPGAKWCTYALVQIRSRRTRRRDWKLKRADCEHFVSVTSLPARSLIDIPSWRRWEPFVPPNL